MHRARITRALDDTFETSGMLHCTILRHLIRAGAAARGEVDLQFAFSQSGKRMFCGSGRACLQQAVDFAPDQPPNGRRFRLLTCIDRLKRECGVLQAIG
jgi:hypothetical protein